MVDNWTLRERPALLLERRIDFDSFELTRDFLDLTADLSEREGFYPDISFGRTHVSMTIRTEDDSDEFGESQLRFARQVNVFAPKNKISELSVTEHVVEKGIK